MLVFSARWPFVRKLAPDVIVFTQAEAQQVKRDSMDRAAREQALRDEHAQALRDVEDARAALGLSEKVARSELEAAREASSSANYRLKRSNGESWPEYTQRQTEALRSMRDTPGLLALLDIVDALEREALLALADSKGDEMPPLQGAVQAVRGVRQRVVAKVYGGETTAQRAREHRTRADVLRMMEMDEERLAALERIRQQGLEASRSTT